MTYTIYHDELVMKKLYHKVSMLNSCLLESYSNTDKMLSSQSEDIQLRGIPTVIKKQEAVVTRKKFYKEQTLYPGKRAKAGR